MLPEGGKAGREVLFLSACFCCSKHCGAQLRLGVGVNGWLAEVWGGGADSCLITSTTFDLIMSFVGLSVGVVATHLRQQLVGGRR